MRLDHFIDQLLVLIARERVIVRRIARYAIPMLLFPVGFALAQMAQSWIGLIAGGLSATVLLVQIEVFLRPSLVRGRTSARDASYYFGRAQPGEPRLLAPVVPLIIPAAGALILSMALFLPPVLALAAPWQRLVAIALGIGVIWAIWQRVATIVAELDGLEQHLRRARASLAPPAPPAPSATPAPIQEGLLDPTSSRRVAGLPLPPLPLSPAAQALLRIETYLMLREAPERSEREVLAALNGLAREAYADELRHWLLPPVGGKIYFPVAAGGVLANMLGATVRRLGMDGAYSASLGTWLVRLPPARSYCVAGRLIDAVVALRLLPAAAIVPHHLTIQGDLGPESRVLSLLHLAATPVLLEAKAGHALGDERPFIMRGGGVLDDLSGRGRYNGPRTDFVDGFLVAGAPELEGIEHLTAHTMNLRIKQVLAFGLLAAIQPADRRSALAQAAAARYMKVRSDLRDLLQQYGLAGALEVDWLAGHWSDVWPFIQRLNTLKQHDPFFLSRAQALRDHALDALEHLATAASGAPRP